MTEPSTEAGRALFAYLDASVDAKLARDLPRIAAEIAAIEAEARAAVLADLRAKVEALWDHDSMSYVAMTRGGAFRDVLALSGE